MADRRHAQAVAPHCLHPWRSSASWAGSLLGRAACAYGGSRPH